MKNKNVLGIIYLAINLINNSKYVGQTSYKLDYRISKHKWDTYNNVNDKSIFHKAIKKYGIENFTFEIIWSGDVNLLDEKEIYYIEENKTFRFSDSYDGGNGYNMTIGGKTNRGYKNISNRGINHPKYNDKKFTFYNINGYIEKDITMYDMRIKYSIDVRNISRLIHNKIKSCYGWVLDISNIDKKFTFYNKEGIIEKDITRMEMETKYKLNKSNLCQLCKGNINIVSGWKLLK